MVTRGELLPARFAIDAFRQQSWSRRELIVVTDRPALTLTAHIAALADPAIRIVRAQPASLGLLRNISLDAARGEWIAQWDDDDLQAPTRLADQMAAVGNHDAIVLDRWLMWWPGRYRLAVSAYRGWEGSLVARRHAIARYPDAALAEDSAMIDAMLANDRTIARLDRPDLYCYVAHGRNAWSTRHFEGLFAAASQRFYFADYDRALALLDQFPIDDYRRALDARDTDDDADPTR